MFYKYVQLEILAQKTAYIHDTVVNLYHIKLNDSITIEDKDLKLPLGEFLGIKDGDNCRETDNCDYTWHDPDFIGPETEPLEIPEEE